MSIMDDQTDIEKKPNDESEIIPEPVAEDVTLESPAPTAQPAPRPGPEPLSPSSERTWAMLAHLSILLNLFTGFLGPITALIIYLVFKDRSRYVAFQSMQSFVFQLVFFIGAGALAAVAWIGSLALSLLLIGLCCIPIAVLISLIPFVAVVYGVIGGIQTGQGDDFRYWLVGDWVGGEKASPGPV
jgi:hypothetical protein